MSVLNADVLNCQSITASGASVLIDNLRVEGTLPNGFYLHNTADPTKVLNFTDGTGTLTLGTSSTANTVYTFPDVTDTLVSNSGLSSVNTMTNKYFPPNTINLSMTPIQFGPNSSTVSGIGIGNNAACTNSTSIIVGSLSSSRNNSFSTIVGSNVAFSYNAVSDLPNNTLLGCNVGHDHTNGFYQNTVVGANALYKAEIYDQIALGAGALGNKLAGPDAIAIGYNTLASVLSAAPQDVVAIGVGSLTSSSNGLMVAIGYNSLNAYTTSGTDNTAIGHSALAASTTGTLNTAVGKSALASYTTLTAGTGGLTAIGSSCLTALTNGASFITGLGASCLTTCTSSLGATAIGFGAQNVGTSVDSNTSVGYNTLNKVTGTFHVAIGSLAAPDITTNSLGTYIGSNCGINSTGSVNLHVGYLTTPSISTGANNTVIGYNAGINITTSTNDICLGSQSSLSAAGVANQIVLGNGAITSFRCQVALTVVSDQRDKTDIIPLETDAGLQFVEYLKPVRFVWNTRDGLKKDISDVGFLAQDLQKTQETSNTHIPGLVYDENPDKMEVTHSKLFPIIVKAIQELNQEIDYLTNILDNYEAALAF